MKLKNKKTGKIVDFKTPLCMCDDKSSWQYDSLSELEEDWEDAPEEPKEFWYIDCDGEVSSIDRLVGYDLNKFKKIGNSFLSREEAEKVVEKLKAWKRLRDKGFKFVEWQKHGITEDFVMDGAVYFEDVKNADRKDLDLLFGGEE